MGAKPLRILNIDWIKASKKADKLPEKEKFEMKVDYIVKASTPIEEAETARTSIEPATAKV